MQSTSNLEVAEVARKLALAVYRVTSTFPPSERYGMVAQMRRAAVSIGSNIAEGCGRHGDRALISFLQIAMGSASELEFQVQLSVDLTLISEVDAVEVLSEIRRVKRMLGALLASLRKQVAMSEAKAARRDR
jgi:four helix bundle protein